MKKTIFLLLFSLSVFLAPANTMHRMMTQLNKAHSRCFAHAIFVFFSVTLPPGMARPQRSSVTTNGSAFGSPGANGDVYASVTDVSGTLFIGGSFTVAARTNANYIAESNGIHLASLRQLFSKVLA